MRVPMMRGAVERRLLVNYRLDPAVVAPMLPAPFEPQLVNGYAVAGICLIRLGRMRPGVLPARVGLTSENAAHRFAVQWMHDGEIRTGVYIPRRDSASAINVAAGDRLFPGHHHRANFVVRETGSVIGVSYVARDRSVSVDVQVELADGAGGSALFGTVEEASRFFQGGAAGFSPTRAADRLDGLELRTNAWRIEAAVMRRVRSSVFDDRSLFPADSITFDSAFVMRNIEVEWHGLDAIPFDGSPLLGSAAGAAPAA